MRQFRLIGLQYTVPLVDTRTALTRHGAPLVLVGSTNGIGVNGGIGVLAVVATAPTPTSM
tara:strand:- start:19 stop:198 length:180 start_codon:yes stop_codon:yes gene_type:complete